MWKIWNIIWNVLHISLFLYIFLAAKYIVMTRLVFYISDLEIQHSISRLQLSRCNRGYWKNRKRVLKDCQVVRETNLFDEYQIFVNCTNYRESFNLMISHVRVFDYQQQCLPGQRATVLFILKSETQFIEALLFIHVKCKNSLHDFILFCWSKMSNFTI